MKRFQLFAFARYYPAGGSGDIAAEADTLEGLFAAFLATDPFMPDKIEVLDMQERKWLKNPRVLVEYPDEATAAAEAAAYGGLGFAAEVCPGSGGHYGVLLTVK